MEPTKNPPSNSKTISNGHSTAARTPPTGTPGPDATPRPAKPGTSMNLATDARGLASKVAGHAKDLISDQLSEQQEKSAGKLDQVADAIRRTGEDLGNATAAPYVDKAAGMLESFSDTVRNATVGGVMTSTDRFARRDPLLFLGGAFVLGFVAARFLKSSTQVEEAAPLLLGRGPAVGPQRGPQGGARRTGSGAR